MLLIFQIPIADSTRFFELTKYLNVPDWQIPKINQAFIRYFGEISRRKLGGYSSWYNESPICNAKRAVRFTKDSDFIFVDSKMEVEVPIEIAFRRLFF